MTRPAHVPRYCPGPDCHCSRRFLERDDHFVCEYCRRIINKVK